MMTATIASTWRATALSAACSFLIFMPSSLHGQDQPTTEQHFSVETPAELAPAEAEAIYGRIVDDMIDGYVLSQDPSATNFQRWQRFNTAPYPSATHGSRYVNNYGNGLAQDYSRPGEFDELPVGAVLVKDSFAVTEAGDVFVGPLFLMEKMSPGFKPESRNWRYSMIMPDGSFFGVTGGDNDAGVHFCITCHQAAGDENDHLFFVPEAYRTSD